MPAVGLPDARWEVAMVRCQAATAVTCMGSVEHYTVRIQCCIESDYGCILYAYVY